MIKIYKQNNKIYISGHSYNNNVCQNITDILKEYELESSFKLMLINKIFNIYELSYNTKEEKDFIIHNLKKFVINNKDIKILNNLY